MLLQALQWSIRQQQEKRDSTEEVDKQEDQNGDTGMRTEDAADQAEAKKKTPGGGGGPSTDDGMMQRRRHDRPLEGGGIGEEEWEEE